MSFQQGLSGLNAASKSLEVTGNNVANASTVGFKQSQAQFADVYASSLTGSGGSQIGIGTKIQTVAQQFTQGNVTASNNPLDIAINGGGFFRMNSNGTTTYSRNGQFQLDKTGYIVNGNGARLTGYTANASGALSTGAPGDLKINAADLPPLPTSKVNSTLNLDSRNTALSAAAFKPTDPTTYDHSTSVSVYDTLGNSHILQTYYVKTAPAPATSGDGMWSMFASFDGVPTPPDTVNPVTGATTATSFGTLTFDGTGAIKATTPTQYTLTSPVTSGAITPLPIKYDFTGTTQFGSSFSVNKLEQDGYTSGRLSGFATGADGTILGRYTNGKSATLGQVVLSNFVNPNGLQSLGNNLWAETSTSGAPLVSTPGSGSLGVLQSSAVEDSNVDLTAELVNMITAQRVYQANAQTIKTQDQILQTLVNLR